MYLKYFPRYLLCVHEPSPKKKLSNSIIFHLNISQSHSHNFLDPHLQKESLKYLSKHLLTLTNHLPKKEKKRKPQIPYVHKS